MCLSSIASADWNGRWQGKCDGHLSNVGPKEYSFAIQIEQKGNELFFKENGITYLPTEPLKIQSENLFEGSQTIGTITPQFIFIHRLQPTGSAAIGSIALYSVYLRLSIDGQTLSISDHAFWEREGIEETSDCVFNRTH